MNLPTAYNGCTCSCHTQPGVIHMIACCSPTPTWGLVERLERSARELDYAAKAARVQGRPTLVFVTAAEDCREAVRELRKSTAVAPAPLIPPPVEATPLETKPVVSTERPLYTSQLDAANAQIVDLVKQRNQAALLSHQYRTERNQYRSLVIAAGNASGAALSDEVTIELLNWVPEEIRSVVGKLRAWKVWVHGYLDKAGVPTDPQPENTARHGCRIVGRLDWLRANLVPANLDVRKILLEMIPGPEGEGVEVYAKNNADIEEQRNKLSEKMDELESRLEKAAHRNDRQAALIILLGGQRDRINDILTQQQIPSTKPPSLEDIDIVERAQIMANKYAKMRKTLDDLEVTMDTVWGRDEPDEAKYPKETYHTMWEMHELVQAGIEVNHDEIEQFVEADKGSRSDVAGRIARLLRWTQLALRACEYGGQCYRQEQEIGAAIRKALSDIASGSPALHRNGAIDHACSLCATYINVARQALDEEPLPAIAHTPRIKQG